MVDFWRDAWLSNVGPLASMVMDPTVVVSLPWVTVAKMVDATRSWKWQEFVVVLPTLVLHRLAATVPPHRMHLADDIGWRWCEYDNGVRVVQAVDRWQLPHEDWCTLNMDGSWVVSIRFATCGGVIWNNLEVDNDDVAQLVQDLTQVSGFHGLVSTIRELLNRDWVVYVRRIRRSANMIADGMAKLAQNTSVSSFRDVKFFTQVFSMPHDEVVYLVHDDVSPTMGVD
ncbi:hypothetical protein V6N13_065369 [Hibiscus sabdariffa]